MEQGEVLLRVEHLCQYFSLGNKELKAVDDVSFEIKKGDDTFVSSQALYTFKTSH